MSMCVKIKLLFVHNSQKKLFSVIFSIPPPHDTSGRWKSILDIQELAAVKFCCLRTIIWYGAILWLMVQNQFYHNICSLYSCTWYWYCYCYCYTDLQLLSYASTKIKAATQPRAINRNRVSLKLKESAVSPPGGIETFNIKCNYRSISHV